MTVEDLLAISSGNTSPKTVVPLSVPVAAGKTGPLYRVHSYHTKVPPEGIRTYISHYTRPNDLVLDPFCGSGMTGLAALLEGRNAILSDLSPAAVHIARNHCLPADPFAFRNAIDHLMGSLAEFEQSLYGIACPSCGGKARVEYTIWADVLRCPRCQEGTCVWEHRTEKGGGLRRLTCPACAYVGRKSDFRYSDTRPVLINGGCCGCGRFEREPKESDVEHIQSIAMRSIPYPVPDVPFDDRREMWRGGHRERRIDSAIDFYTARNLSALAAIKATIDADWSGRIHEALLFAFTSVVNRASRRYQWNAKRPTNVLMGTLYVPSLSYEFNVFSLLRRKISPIEQLFKTTACVRGQALVRESSATDLSWLPDACVDFVFTDPPFGSNIFYADSSFLWESWLGRFTDQSLEAVINKSRKPKEGGKTLEDYRRIMVTSLGEIHRVLKPTGWMSIVFHNSDDRVWEAFRTALEESGFQIGTALAFDKRQPTFKGVKAIVENERVPFYDIVISAQRRALTRGRKNPPPDYQVLKEILLAHIEREVTDQVVPGRTMAFLHSLAVRTCLERGWSIEGLDYGMIEDLCIGTSVMTTEQASQNTTARQLDLFSHT